MHLVERFLDLKSVQIDEREAATKLFVLQIEPFVFKVLALFESDIFEDLAEDNRGLSTDVGKLISTGRIPFEGLSDEEFRSKQRWTERSSFAHALRDIVPARLMTAHQANAVTDGAARREVMKGYVEEKIDRRDEPLWESVLAVMLGIIDANAEDIYEVCVPGEGIDLSDPLCGKVLNKEYKTTRLIGQGAYGKVYEGYDLSNNDRRVVIKFVGDALDARRQRQMENRFDFEGRYLSKLQHQNIAYLYQIGTEIDLGPYIVMEYVPGVELRDLLEVGRLDLQLALQVALEITNGLEEIHSQGIVHRDLKPENIRLKSRGRGRLRSKIVDFGLAVDPDQDIRLSRSDEKIRTPYYMSPEQLTGAEVDARSDLYALGVVLFEMITGFPPFSEGAGARSQDQASHQVYAQNMHEEAPRLSEVVSDIPANLDELVGSLLAKSPEDRPDETYSVGWSLDSVLNDLRRKSGVRIRERLNLDRNLEGHALLEALQETGLLKNTTRRTDARLESNATVAQSNSPGVDFSPVEASPAVIEQIKEWKAEVEADEDPAVRFGGLVDIANAYHEEFEATDRAIEVYREALQLRPASVAVLRKLLEIYRSTEQWREAVEILERLIEQQGAPDHKAKFHYTIAVIYRDKIGEPLAAVEHFDATLDHNIKKLEAFEAIDRLLTGLGNWKELERAYRRMLRRLVESDVEGMVDFKFKLWENLGEIYRTRLGHPKSAIQAFETACQLRPGNERLRLILEDLYEEAGGIGRGAQEKWSEWSRVIAVRSANKPRSNRARSSIAFEL